VIMGVPRYDAFPDDGRTWRLDWVGRAQINALRQTPLVDVQISALKSEGRHWRGSPRAIDPESTKMLQVPIHLWPELRIGTCWKSGRREFPDAGETIEIAVDVLPCNLRMAKAYDRMDYLWKRRTNPGNSHIPSRTREAMNPVDSQCSSSLLAK
jgi:hypothetical protein